MLAKKKVFGHQPNNIQANNKQEKKLWFLGTQQKSIQANTISENTVVQILYSSKRPHTPLLVRPPKSNRLDIPPRPKIKMTTCFATTHFSSSISFLTSSIIYVISFAPTSSSTTLATSSTTTFLCTFPCLFFTSSFHILSLILSFFLSFSLSFVHFLFHSFILSFPLYSLLILTF